MTEYKMTDKYRKVLTEMIGECWHEFPDYGSQKEYKYIGCPHTCLKCKKGHNLCIITNRTFTADEDIMKVFRWLVDNGKFEILCESEIIREHYMNDTHDNKYLIAWLIYDDKRFCCLVAMAKLEGVI